MLAILGTIAAYFMLIWFLGKILDYIIRLPIIERSDQKFIFITGCDTGFGKALTKQLDRKRYYVFAGCLTEKGASKLRQETSARVVTFLLDVTQPESVKKAFDLVKVLLPQRKGLWAVVNNAGVAGRCGPSEWVTTEDYKSCLEVNTWGTIRVCNTFLPLVKMENGRIVNMSCVMGRSSQPWMVPYSVSKFALEAYTDSLRREMKDFNVSVHLIEPSLFRTDFCNTRYLQENLTNTWHKANKDKKDEYGEDYFHSAINAMPGTLDFFASNDTSKVIDAYEHAITAIFPRTRYVIGNHASFFHLVIQALPEGIGDFILHSFFRKYVLPPAGAQRRQTSLKPVNDSFQYYTRQLRQIPRKSS